MQTREDALQLLTRLQAVHHVKATLWDVLHYGLSLLQITLPLLVATLHSEVPHRVLLLLAVCSAVSTGLSVVMSPKLTAYKHHQFLKGLVEVYVLCKKKAPDHEVLHQLEICMIAEP